MPYARSFSQEGNWRPKIMTPPKVETDDLGHYRLSGLPAGSYFVLVAGDIEGGEPARTVDVRDVMYGQTYYPHVPTIQEAQRIPVAPSTEARNIDFVVIAQLRTFQLTGKVSNVDANSRPAAYELVRAGDLLYDDSTGIVSLGGVHEDGSFLIPTVPPGDYVLTIRQQQSSEGKNPSQYPPGIWARAVVPVHIQDADVNLNAALEKPGEVKGRVVWDEGATPAPVDKLAVWLGPADPYDDLGSSAGPLSQDGEFDILNVPAGRRLIEASRTTKYANATDIPALYVKHAECSGVDYTIRPLTIQPDAIVTDCVLTLATDAANISGKVMDGDKSMHGYDVVSFPESAELRSSPQYSIAVKIERNGTFKLPQVIPGDYLVFAVPHDPEQSYYAPGFVELNIALAERVSVKLHETKTITLRPIKSPQ
jgi:hypothetical protein